MKKLGLVFIILTVLAAQVHALKTIEPEPGVGTIASHLEDINDNFVEHEADISGLTTGKESATSNDFDPDRIAGDTVDDNLLDVAAIAEIGADDIAVNSISGATYDDLNDYLNTTGTAGFINGGMAISDDGDGTITVAAGSGYIRIADSNTAQIRAFDIAETYVDLTDDALNYVYVYYNSGAPATAATTDLSSINHRDEFVIGLVYRNGTDLHIGNAGQRLTCFKNAVYLHSWETDGLERASGLVTTHTGTRNIAITSGVLYLALNRTEIAAFDSSGADSFTLVYSDGLGGWTETTGQTQISNTLYDDGDGTPGNLTVTRYRTDWVYMLVDGTVYVKMGTNNDILADALAEDAPSDLPNELQSPMTMLIAKIIIQQNASGFYEVHTPWDSVITPSVTTDHGNLGGLADDDHPQYGALAQAETIAGNWVNTTNPWADNEVADDITITNITQITNRAITNLAATNWRLFYSADGSAPVELALGADGTYLRSNGASSAPSFDTPGGSGDMLQSVYDTGPNNKVDDADAFTTVDTGDEAATFYPIFVDGATGTQVPETDGECTFNPSTGVFTATEFSGGGGSLTSVDAATGDSATAFFDAGTIEHERGGLEADVSAYAGLINISGGVTSNVTNSTGLTSALSLGAYAPTLLQFASASALVAGLFDGEGTVEYVLTDDGDGTYTFKLLDEDNLAASLNLSGKTITFPAVLNFSGATTFQIPNGANPTTDATGEIAIDTDDNFVEFYNGTASVVVSATISETSTISEPDLQTDDIVLKHFDARAYPHGVTMIGYTITTSASASDTHVLEEWDDRAGSTQTTSESITLSASQRQEDDGSLSDAAFAADSYLVLNLDDATDDLAYMEVTYIYRVNPGD